MRSNPIAISPAASTNKASQPSPPPASNVPVRGSEERPKLRQQFGRDEVRMAVEEHGWLLLHPVRAEVCAIGQCRT